MDVFKTHEARKVYLDSYYEPALERWPVAYESLFVETNYGRTHLLRCGEASLPPLVLTNGIGDDIISWSDTSLLKNLCKHFQLFLPDRIGDPGRSELVKKINSSEGYANWMKEILDDLCIDKVRFLGIHQGGWEVLNYGIYLPEYTDRLVCVNPAGGIRSMRVGAVLQMFSVGSSRKKLEKYAHSNAAPSYQWDADYFDRAVEKALFIRKNCNPVFTMPRRFRDSELRRISARTLLVLGEYSRWYDRKKIKNRAKKLIGDIDVCTLSDTGLDVFIEQPDASSTVVLDFLLKQ
jgi:pimeloyl-ACP methyl ester carboxylesterase